MRLEKAVAPNAVILSIIPWFHAFGCLTLTCSMLNRDQIVFLPKFEEVSFLRAIMVSENRSKKIEADIRTLVRPIIQYCRIIYIFLQ